MNNDEEKQEEEFITIQTNRREVWFHGSRLHLIQSELIETEMNGNIVYLFRYHEPGFVSSDGAMDIRFIDIQSLDVLQNPYFTLFVAHVMEESSVGHQRIIHLLLEPMHSSLALDGTDTYPELMAYLADATFLSLRELTEQLNPQYIETTELKNADSVIQAIQTVLTRIRNDNAPAIESDPFFHLQTDCSRLLTQLEPVAHLLPADPRDSLIETLENAITHVRRRASRDKGACAVQ